jgi:hypothetical protein
MDETAMRSLPNTARLKNSSISHLNEICLIELNFLQGIQLYAQNRHTSPETLTAKNSSVSHVIRKKLIGVMSS